jgi:hypothetical protein
MGEPMMAGVQAETVKSPNHNGFLVVSVRKIPNATLCIQVPTDDTKDDVIARAKLRCRKGANEAIATRPTYRGE